MEDKMELRERLKFILKDTNPWWGIEPFKLNRYFERDIIAQLKKFLPVRQIVALVGLRRTGKTTLMLKLVEQWLKEMPAKRVLYFSFDDFSALEIEDIIQAYTELISGLNIKTDRLLFCFDEIQKLTNWQEKIKRIYDAYPQIKIIISGSESLFLRKKIKETLAGRIYEFKVTQLTFSEYLRFKGMENLYQNIQLHKDKIIGLYREFLRTNGFPELAQENDNTIIHKYLRESVIDKIIFKDIPSLFKIKNIPVLSEILDIIVYGPGQLIDISKLSKELGLTRQAISNYLDYLEKTFLVKKLYNFSPNLRKQKRALKKYYPAIIFPSLIEQYFSLAFENSIIWQLDAQFFYRDEYKNEVDAIIVGKNKELSAIEIKTGDIDLKGVRHFIKKFNPKNALVITLDRQQRYKEINSLPFYIHLLGKD
jgi:predicted AAA+ superfamily ATPase